MNIDSIVQRKLFIKPYDRMIKDLVTEIEEGIIILDPDYQRKYVWNDKKASLLVESILLNIPIPVIYASEENLGKWNIVDGVQRLCSLKRFFNDEFKLQGLETLSDFNGLKFSKLDEVYRKKIERGELRIILLLNDSDPDIQFDIFTRLNTGSVKLNEQELRNCLYRGRLNNAIKNLIKENDFINEIIPAKTDRMLANELIIRYLAISKSFNKSTYKMEHYDGRIKNLLNNYMQNNQNPDDCFIKTIEDKILTQLRKAYNVYGKKAFMKNKNATKVNASLFECIMLGFEDYTEVKLMSKMKKLIQMKENLLMDAEFLSSIDKATGNTETIKTRHTIFLEKLKDIMTDASERQI